jgi:hypothetical protein
VIGRLVDDDVYMFFVARDNDEIRYLETYVADWWQEHVIEGRVPDPPEQPVVLGPEVNATPEQEEAWARLRELRLAVDDLTKAAEEVKAQLAIPHADITGTGWRARWIARQSTSWKDVAQAAGADPRLVAAYTRTSVTLDIRETKTRETT